MTMMLARKIRAARTARGLALGKVAVIEAIIHAEISPRDKYCSAAKAAALTAKPTGNDYF